MSAAQQSAEVLLEKYFDGEDGKWCVYDPEGDWKTAEELEDSILYEVEQRLEPEGWTELDTFLAAASAYTKFLAVRELSQGNLALGTGLIGGSLLADAKVLKSLKGELRGSKAREEEIYAFLEESTEISDNGDHYTVEFESPGRLY